VAYTRSLHDNPGYVRALFRLAILAGWDGRLDSALALLRDAREVEPMEPDVRLWEAKFLQWQGQYRSALARYDSLIAESPERHDPRFGRAQTLAWSGNYAEADREFQALVAADPDDVESLVALAQLRLWQARPAEADRYNDLALRAAPEHRAARVLQGQVRALRRPRLELSLGMTHDSEHNNAWWQSLGTSFLPAPGLRAFASVGAYEASDPQRDGTRLSGEVGATWNWGNFTFTGAFGANSLNSDAGTDRSLGTWRTAASYRITPSAGGGLGYSHYSFDETALLLASRIDIDELSADFDAELRPNLSLGGGLGVGYLSDDNRRKSAVIALTQQVAPRWTIGVLGRGLWYDVRGNGYFSPDRFLTGEIRGTYTYGFNRWEGRLHAGLGLQQRGSGTGTDGEWRTELRIARRWSVINEIALLGGVYNSAISSASGAYRYYRATVWGWVGLWGGMGHRPTKAGNGERGTGNGKSTNGGV
jgi:tetratricopeptide (TPR) repeat protein